MKKLILLSTAAILALGACKRELPKPEGTGTETTSIAKDVKAMTDIVVPEGFTWESSKDVKLKVAISDQRFGGKFHVVSIYSSDPAEGGNLIARGSATPTMPFEATLYTPTSQQFFYLTKVAPDGSVMTEKIVNASANLQITLGQNGGTTKLGKGTAAGPNCSSGCSTTHNNYASNISVSSGTKCLTGTYSGAITISSTAVVRVCGTATISSLTLSGSGRLEITETAVVTIGSVSYNSTSSSIKNWGTATLNNHLALDGTLENNGTFTVNTGYNLNVDNGGTLTNNGTLYAKGNYVVNSGAAVNNTCIIVVSGNATVNDCVCFNNNCRFEVQGNLTIAGETFTNNEYVKVTGTTTVNSAVTFNMDGGAQLTSGNLVLNGKIYGTGSTSLVKVNGTSTLNSGGQVKGSLSYCDANGIETNNASFTYGAVASCSLTIPVSSCNPEGNTNACPDSDSDGVCDANDCYPNDATKAYCNYYPSSNTYASVAFEDLWPYQGDYDMNDVVVDVRYNIVTNAANKVVKVIGTYMLRASGAALNNSFYVDFPVNKSYVSGITGATQENNSQSDLVLLIAPSIRTALPMWNTIPGENTSPAVTYNVSFDIAAANAPTLATFALGVYDPFIATGNGREYEVHLPGKANTPLANTALFGTGHDNSSVADGRYYVSNTGGYPWAITVPASWSYPVERADITTAYLKFAQWVSSNGTQYTDWYSNTASGYRDNTKIYQ